MGYICPHCGEGLPEDELCPCMAGPNDGWENETRAFIRGPLTRELDDIRSPVRQFLSERFTDGLRDIQSHCRGSPPALVVCQRPSCGGSGSIVVTGLVGEQDALAEQVGFGAAVHLSFDHLDAVDVAFDGAGAVGDGEPGGDGGPVFAESFAEAA
jgi:hypothetical protein